MVDVLETVILSHDFRIRFEGPVIVFVRNSHLSCAVQQPLPFFDTLAVRVLEG